MTVTPPPMGCPPPPDYLDQALKARWNELAPIAWKRGALTKNTVDAFARYIIADREYLKATQHCLRALQTGNVSDAATWSQIQDRYFRELHTTGKMFGLSPDGDLF